MSGLKNVIVFANQKGGVTKSTSSVNTAASLSKVGKKVLFIDTDPQGNGSSILGFNTYEEGKEDYISTYDLITGNDSISSENDFIYPSQFSNLFLTPSHPDLYNADAELAGKYTAVFALRKIINLYELRKKFDYIIFDTPPNLGIMTYTALTSADKIIIPIIPDKYALGGMTQLEKAIIEVKENLNPDLEIFGVLMARIVVTENLSKQIMKATRDYFGPQLVFKTFIRKNVTAEEANALGKPVVFYNESYHAAIDYANVAEEILQRK